MERPHRQSTIPQQVGALLRRRRCELGLSQEHVAYEIGLTQGSISNYEVGRTDIPLSVLFKICATLRITAADLIMTFPINCIENAGTGNTRLIA